MMEMLPHTKTEMLWRVYDHSAVELSLQVTKAIARDICLWPQILEIHKAPIQYPKRRVTELDVPNQNDECYVLRW